MADTGIIAISWGSGEGLTGANKSKRLKGKKETGGENQSGQETLQGLYGSLFFLSRN